MKDAVARDVALLTASRPADGYEAFRRLCGLSEQSDAVSPYLEDFWAMREHPSAYVRTRGLVLLAYNAAWDASGRLDGWIDEYLSRVLDPKPTVARQCIQALPRLAAGRPALAPKIRAFLQVADCSQYADSMAPLLQKDMMEALTRIEENS